MTGNHVCGICNKSFKRLCHLKDHERGHSGIRSQCDMCSKSFVTPALMRRHKRVHLGQKNHVCLRCRKAFTRKDLLDRHQQIHSGEKHCLCEICGRGFSLKINLEHHKLTHTGEKPYSCVVCSKTFAQAGHLTQHTACHSEQRPFVCTACNRTFARAVTLKRHELIHKRPNSCEQSSQPRLSVSTANNSSVVFYQDQSDESGLQHQDQNLVLHKSDDDDATVRGIRECKKTVPRMHVCGLCEKAFQRAEHLEHHMLTHTGQKNHVCGVCRRAFSRANSLKRHSLTHKTHEQAAENLDVIVSMLQQVSETTNPLQHASAPSDSGHRVLAYEMEDEIHAACNSHHALWDNPSLELKSSLHKTQHQPAFMDSNKPLSASASSRSPKYADSSEKRNVSIDHNIAGDGDSGTENGFKLSSGGAGHDDDGDGSHLEATAVEECHSPLERLDSSPFSASNQNPPAVSSSLAMAQTAADKTSTDYSDSSTKCNKRGHAKRSFSCQLCHQNFRTTKMFNAHRLSLHNIEPKFSCTAGGDSGDISAKCEDAVKWDKVSKNCEVAPKSLVGGGGCNMQDPMPGTQTKVEQDEHAYPDTELHQPLTCGVCSVTFPTFDTAEKHMLLDHVDADKAAVKERDHQPSLMCDLCGNIFRRRGDLNRHRLSHAGHRPYKCGVCHKAFTRNQHLKEHLLIHAGQKTYLCDVCGSGFITAATLKKHEVVHSRVKSHICDVCEKLFLRRGDLTEHKLTHTGQKKFLCNVCHKAFYRVGNLRQHRLTHNQRKPHACNLCPKSFTTNSHLQTHKLNHTGQRPHTCLVCHKAFKVSSHLREHALTHTGEKRHVCGICDKAFSRASHKKRHMLLHTNGNAGK